MKKIISLFQRNHHGNKSVRDEYTPATEWVVAGEGRATRKWDGTAVMVDQGKVFKRYDAKTGRTPPANFVPAQPSPDPISGHWPGWVPATGPDSRYILEGVQAAALKYPEGLPDGTYELCGPKITTRLGTNFEGFDSHVLIPHGQDLLDDAPRTFAALMEYLRDLPIEGIVWHHPDGRMVKIKKPDFPY